METEIELKFFVSSELFDQIRNKIETSKVLQQSQRILCNRYFDTSDLLLRRHDIGLRIRRYGNTDVQTLKTSGRVTAGLHQRPEYNAELSSSELDLSLIPHTAWPDGIEITQLQAKLLPLFTTNFNREQWLLSMPDNSQIEVAFDTGEVSTEDQDKTCQICEIELELKAGQVDALFSFARSLTEQGGLRLGNLSKAAMGYRLVTDHQGDEVKPLEMVPVNHAMNVKSGFIAAIEWALSHWHYHEQIYVERQDQSAINEMYHAILLIRQAFNVYESVIPRRANSQLRQELNWLDEQLKWVHEAQAISRLCQDKGYFLRKLNAQKWICSKLEQRYQALPNREAMLALINSSRYCHLLLDLSRWVLTRGWRPFVDDKASQTLAQPLSTFANKALAHSWDDLLNVFNLDHHLSRTDYMKQQRHLLCNLMTGTCLAGLYTQQNRDPFRFVWFDILQGMDDLWLFEPIHALLDDPQLSQEDRTQIEKWLNRKEESLLHAMFKSRETAIMLPPYWLV